MPLLHCSASDAETFGMASQPRRKLTADLIPRARKLAALGLPLAAVAEGCGISRQTLHRWRTEAAAEGLERDLCDAIEEGHRDGELALLRRLHRAAADGDTKAAQWLLTHAPRWRETWSDAAADRRTERRTVALVVQAIAAADLPAEIETRLLLQLQAHGLGAIAADGEGCASGPSCEP